MATNAQSIQASLSVPAENLINEEFCFDVIASNTGPTGYQPYLRVWLPPEVPANTLSVEFLGQPVASIVIAGTFVGVPLSDPNLATEDPNNLVSGTGGYTLVVVNLPIGSMIDGGVDGEVELCADLSGSGVSIGIPVQIEIQPVYRFGDTPTGENGSIMGTASQGAVTPTLYSMAHRVNITDAVAGSCMQLQYDVTVDIAEQEQVTDLVISNLIPSGIQFVGILAVTPGCIVIQQPTVGSSGDLIVQCDNALGTSASTDVQLSYFASIGNVLDVNSCDSIQFINEAQVSSNEVLPISATSNAKAYHITFKPQLPTEDVAPGETLSIGFEYTTAEYIDGIDAMEFRLVLPDGLLYTNLATMNGANISASSVTSIGGGETELIFDLHASNGSDFAPCEVGNVFIYADLLETYQNGEFLTANDELRSEGIITYSLINGATDCARPYTGSYRLPSAAVLKETISTPANGYGYVPGEMVTYRLTMEIPSGDARNVVFEDLFPIPIHDVTDLSLVFGEDVVHSPLNNVSETPVSITIDASKNTLFIDWGSISGPSLGIPLVISVDISIAISSEPFADGLVHTNFARFYSSNTLLESSVDVDLTTLSVGAPELIMTKGIAATDQPNAILSPINIPINANASGIDAWDYLTFMITLTNTGEAPAYDIIVNDFPPFPELGNCTLLSVENGEGSPLIYSGSLFTTGLVIDEIQDQIAGSQRHKGYIEYQCRVQDEISARDFITNIAEATWAAVPGSPDRFNPVTESAQVYFARPSVETNVLQIQPNYSGNNNEVHIGELVTYETNFRIPEGFTRNSTLEITLPEGLSLEEFVSFERPVDMFFENGTLSQIINGMVISDIGVGIQNQDRKITIPLGDVDNGSSDNDEDEFIRLVYSAVVLNTEVNQNGYNLAQLATIKYTNPVSSALTSENDSHVLEVIEAELDVDISFFDDTLLPGEQTFVTVTVSHLPTSTGNAYDIHLINDLPLGIQFVNGSFLSECEELISWGPVNSFGSLVTHWDSLPLGVTCEVVYSIQILESFPPCTTADNCLSLEYQSAFSAHLDTLTYGPSNQLGYMRTGNFLDEGGVNNDYLAEKCAIMEVVSATLNEPAIMGDNAICEGAPLTLSINEYPGLWVNYVWEGPGVPSGFNDNELVISNPDLLDAGMYQVHVEVGDCSSDTSAVFALIVHSNPAVVVENSSLPCASGLDDAELIPIITGGEGPFSFVWNGPEFFSNDSIAVIQNVVEENAGVYTLNVTDANGCAAPAESAQLDVSQAPPLPVIANGAELCQGLSFTLSSSNYPGAVAYHWNTPTGEVVTTTPFLEITDVNTDLTGEYTVWVELESCATDASFEVDVLVHPIPAPPVFEANEQVLCVGNELNFTTAITSDAYVWSGPNGYSGNTMSPPAIPSVAVSNDGVYSLTITDGLCQSEPYQVDVTVNALPLTPGLASNSPLCIGDQLMLVSGSNAEFFEWHLPEGNVDTTTDGTLIITEVNETNEGDYTLFVFNGECWSNPSLEENVEINVIPNETAYAGANVVACEGNPIEVDAINDPLLTGFWTHSDETLQLLSPNSHTTVVAGAESGESYTLVWSLFTDGCGIYSTDEVTIFAPTIPFAKEDYFEMVEGEQQDIFIVFNDEFSDVEYDIEIIDLPDHGSAQVSGDVVEYEPDFEFSGEDEFIYELCLKDCPSMCDTALVKIRIFPYLHIPDIITPNNDGVNDGLVMDGIGRFPENKLFIYNRWGRLIYEQENYQNDWEGTWKGKPLPNGTYYYVFNNRDTGETLGTGYITIHQ
jgi:gliding motility-associated-like protein